MVLLEEFYDDGSIGARSYAGTIVPGPRGWLFLRDGVKKFRVQALACVLPTSNLKVEL